jgi:hypothetical protein
MDPVTIATAGIAIAGLTTQGVGMFNSYQGSKAQADANKKVAEASGRISGFELQIEGQKMKAMELDAKRRQLEIIRAQQRAAAASLAVTNAQGAKGGSALQGALGQISGTTGQNLLGVTQNLEIGRDIFGFNAAITNEKQTIAAQQALSGVAGTQIGLGSGMSSLGGSLVTNASTLGRLSGPAFASSSTSAPPGQTYGQFLGSIGSNGIY